MCYLAKKIVESPQTGADLCPIPYVILRIVTNIDTAQDPDLCNSYCSVIPQATTLGRQKWFRASNFDDMCRTSTFLDIFANLYFDYFVCPPCVCKRQSPLLNKKVARFAVVHRRSTFFDLLANLRCDYCVCPPCVCKRWLL